MAIRRGFRRNKVNIIQTKLDNVNFLKRQYNFKGLYHFTDFSNLRNILESGYLYSRNGAINKFGDFIDGADPDIIGKLNKFGKGNIKNCVRFYYRPRVSTLYINEGVKLKQYSKDTHIPMPVYLLFDESLIYSNNVVYSDGNATNYNTSFGDTDEFFIKMDWRLIFSEGGYSKYIDYSDEEQRNEIKRKRQAELLSKVPVSIEKYLKKIIFRCEADMQRAINVLGNNDKYEVDCNLFSNKKDVSNDIYRNNYIEKYDCYIDKEYYIIRMFFKYNLEWPSKFDIKVCTTHSDGKEKTFELSENDYLNKKNIFKEDNGILKLDETYKYVIFQSLNNNLVFALVEYHNIKKVQVYINNFLYIEEYYNNENEIRRI